MGTDTITIFLTPDYNSNIYVPNLSNADRHCFAMSKSWKLDGLYIRGRWVETEITRPTNFAVIHYRFYIKMHTNRVVQAGKKF